MTTTMGFFCRQAGGGVLWQDEFDQPLIDATMWDAEDPTFNYGDASTPKFANLNALITETPYISISAASAGGSGNSLKLTGIKGSYPTGGPTPNPATWKSGCIRSKPPFTWGLNQRLEARCKVDTVVGIRPQFWARYMGGGTDAEVDVSAFYPKVPQNLGGALIWSLSPVKQNPVPSTAIAPATLTQYASALRVAIPAAQDVADQKTLDGLTSEATYWQDAATNKLPAGAVAYDQQVAAITAGWHVWSVDWLADRFIFSLDGLPFRTITAWASTFSPGGGGPPTFPDPFQDSTPMAVSLSNQIGGVVSAFSWNGTTGSQNTQPVDPAVTSTRFEFEYVRVTDLS